jgi:hypothetical protein
MAYPCNVGTKILEPVVKAVVNGDRIECGACGGLLAMNKTIDRDSESITIDIPNARKICKSIEIKCKAKRNGHTCNTVNEVCL